jgi:hypothetical protein
MRPKVMREINNAGVSELRADILGCSRCGLDHKGLKIVEFRRPFCVGGMEFNFWGLCPLTGEPLFARVNRMGNHIRQGKLLVGTGIS